MEVTIRTILAAMHLITTLSPIGEEEERERCVLGERLEKGFRITYALT